MNSFKLLLTFTLLLSIFSCSEKKTSDIRVVQNTTELDSIFIYELPSKIPLAKVKIIDNERIRIPNNKDQLVLIETKEPEISTTLILEPNKTKAVTIDTLGIHIMNSIADSTQQYLQKSTNLIIRDNYQMIGSPDKSRELRNLLDSVLLGREKLIKELQLNEGVSSLLYSQNKFRIYNLLFYYGMQMHSIPANNSFYDFIENIPLNEESIKSSPNIALYTLEIKYNRQNDPIKRIQSFINFITEKTKNKDQANNLIAFYLRELLQTPHYWEKHYKTFSSNELKDIITEQKNNPYSYLYEKDVENYFSALRGNKALKFEALKLDSSTFYLDSLKGQLVVIDAWATWCGPCIDQKPEFTKIAQEFNDVEELSFISVSIDKSFNKWKRYFIKKPASAGIMELNVSNAYDEFESAFNVQSIPRYILIGRDGNIIDADMEDPADGMRDRIKSFL